MMIKYFKDFLDCLWEIEKDLHAIAISKKVSTKRYEFCSVVTGKKLNAKGEEIK